MKITKSTFLSAKQCVCGGVGVWGNKPIFRVVGEIRLVHPTKGNPVDPPHQPSLAILLLLN